MPTILRERSRGYSPSAELTNSRMWSVDSGKVRSSRKSWGWVGELLFLKEVEKEASMVRV